jgi:phenylalanyl-tRNA synthetase beta chain
VLLELGQPLHAFDANKIEGNLEVRFAKEKERITLLDENKLKLDKNCLVIADQSEPVALAGIMGGFETGISSKTLSIYLESAFFKPEAIRGRARKFSLQTDASTRFERGVDFELQTLAIERASLLIHESIGGKFSPVQEFSKRSSIPKNKDISLNFKNVNKILGTEFSKPFIRRNLKSLGLVNSQSTGDAIKVKVPSWRFDLKIEADLIEEIARLVGYNNLPQSPLSKKINNPVDSLHNSVRNSFKFMGYNEVITYSFIDESLAELVEPKKGQLIFVNNPISENMNIMRPSLLPSLLDTLSYNLNQGIENLKIFEIGTVFQKGKNHKINQKELIGGLISGIKDKDNWSGLNEPMDFFDLKGDLENVLDDSSKYYFKKAEIPYLHPGKTALLLKGESVIGYIGSINPKLLDKFDIKQGVNFFEISINATSSKSNIKFEKFSRFPFAQRDLSFIVDEGIASSMITDSIISKAGDNLKEIKLFDVYKGKGIPQGKTSLTYALGWQASNRTLKDKEIDEIIEKLVAFLSKKFNAKLRS